MYEAKFTDGWNTWMLRVDGGLDGKVSVNTASEQRVKALHGVSGLKIVARAHGTVKSKVPWTAPPVAYTSITYTYRDGARGQRWVTTRFIDTLDHGKRAYIEVTVAGRPQDQAGLKRVLAEATQRVALRRLTVRRSRRTRRRSAGRPHGSRPGRPEGPGLRGRPVS